MSFCHLFHIIPNMFHVILSLISSHLSFCFMLFISLMANPSNWVWERNLNSICDYSPNWNSKPRNFISSWGESYSDKKWNPIQIESVIWIGLKLYSDSVVLDVLNIRIDWNHIANKPCIVYLYIWGYTWVFLTKFRNNCQ